MSDKKNPFAAIGDAARSARSSEPQPQPQPDQPETSSKKNGKGQGKRSHPDYRQTTIYINKQLEKKMKAAFLEDGVEDFSQWIEERIEEWLEGRKQG
ncbi:hypothetical protein [Nostoc sp.]